MNNIKLNGLIPVKSSKNLPEQEGQQYFNHINMLPGLSRWKFGASSLSCGQITLRV